MADTRRDLFTDLPIEVVLEIVKHINAHTLRSLLLACKRLRPYATHFRDDEVLPAFFSGIPGVRTVSGLLQLPASVYRGCHIMMVDFSLGTLNFHLPKRALLLDDPLCFLHTTGHPDQVARWTSLLDPQRRSFHHQQIHGRMVHGINAHGFAGFLNPDSMDYRSSPYYFEFPHIYYPLQLYVEKVWYPKVLENSPGIVFNRVPKSDRVISSRLKYLRITATSLVENICLPLLRKLSVEFYRTKDDTVPEIRNIHAPYLLVFSVHFSGKMPTLSRINVCSFQCSSKRAFELVNTNATSPTSFMEDSTMDYTDDYKNMDFDFFSHLDTVSLTGVPDFVFNAAHQRRQLRELHWHHSVAYTHPSMPARAEKLALKSLRSLVINSGAPNFTPPTFATPYIRFLFVSLTGFNPSLGDLIPNAAKHKRLKVLQIVSIPLDKRLIGHPQAHITLTLDDISSIQRMDDFPRAIFHGCFLGENNTLATTRHIVHTRYESTDSHDNRSVELMCVRPRGDTSDTLDLRFLDGTDLPVSPFRVTQLFNEFDRPWRKLCYTIPVDNIFLDPERHALFEEVYIRAGFEEVEGHFTRPVVREWPWG